MSKPVVLFVPTKILLETPQSEWLETLGEKFVILTSAGGRDALGKHLPNMVDRMEFFDNFNDNPAVELRALDVATDLETDLVIALAEVDLLRAARVRDRLNFSTTKHEQNTQYFRDKFLMKQRLAEHGIKIHPMRTFQSALELKDFVDTHGYPVVAKPRDGRGSGGVCVLRDHADFLGYISTMDATTFQNLMVEKFVEAPMLHVNGLYVDGEAVFITPVRANIGCLAFLDGESLGVAMLDRDSELRKEAVQLTKRILEEALPSPRNFLFYLELFVVDGELVVCEIASRLGGNGVNQEVIEAFGINPRLEFIKAERGFSALRGVTLEPKALVGYIAVPPREGVLIDFPDSPQHDFIRSYNITGQRGKKYEKMKLTNGEVVCAVVEGATEAHVASRLNEFDAWVATNFVWQQ
ncbi:hypothetical protein RRU01S_35_00290 [Agrobacterium rubi TR3 = NBRC 13261]|uniref:ATP-grasp domain-containing protein n=1 Tax=Agrobacterium rubi TR3 = NBRC 13261 TaxID=1368415 RepID=A0A081D324_9HYPH|nr:ATP-grasp domain-containing protein [Agrobacterium rubi]MBP1881643.1 hypothetical protein [Agrobacterium rubi]MCL6655469.1 hypothetical protein [Agrobacterium rubi]GAK73320.1 hypothetical protein RRU01S_35_00290 [Agrobacterium rubi TR3 = NBRC 13261]